MEIRIKTKTAEGVQGAIRAAMDQNRRCRVFHAVGNLETGALAVAPVSDEIDAYGENWRGCTGIQRWAWDTVPGYAEKTAGYLAAILQGDKTVRL